MLDFLLENVRLLAFFLSSSLFFFLESYWAFKPFHEPRGVHIARNLGIAFLNGLVYGIFFAAAVDQVTSFTSAHQFGLFRWLNFSWPVELVLSVLALDFVIYLWHVIAHKVHFIWIFHLVHHVDSTLDFTTGMRFHWGEMIGLILFHLPFYFFLGVQLESLIVTQILLIIFDHFGHANYRVPGKIDQVLRLVFVTSNYHQVHHSDALRELNSNYGTIFSLWDRWLRTYNPRRDIKAIRTGIKGYPRIVSWWELLWLPFRNKKRP